MSVRVFLGGDALGSVPPEEVPAYLALSRGLALPWHQDPAGDALYIAPPLVGRTIAIAGAAAPDVSRLLQRRLTPLGARVSDGRGPADVYVLLQPEAGRERPTAAFSLRRPLLSRRLARHLAAVTAGATEFRPWLDARKWCPAVRLTWDPALSPDLLAARVASALQRFFSRPLPPLVTSAFSALLAALPGGSPPAAPEPAPVSAAAPESIPPTAAESPGEAPDAVPQVLLAAAGSPGHAPRATAAPPPAAQQQSASPLVLGLSHQRDASLPAPPPLPPVALAPPGSGVVRVFTPRLNAPLPPNLRPVPREAPPTFAVSSPARTSPVQVAPVRSLPMRVVRPAPRPKEEPDLHLFRITPSARVPG